MNAEELRRHRHHACGHIQAELLTLRSNQLQVIERDRLAEFAAVLDETQRMLEYLWGAIGNNAPDLPVHDLFTADDPLADDVMTVVGKARLLLHSNGYALSALDSTTGDERG